MSYTAEIPDRASNDFPPTISGTDDTVSAEASKVKMNRSYAYGLAGAVLAVAAVLVVRNCSDGKRLEADPSTEIERMMAQTRQKVTEIQRNFSEFRQVLTQATAIDPRSQPFPNG